MILFQSFNRNFDEIQHFVKDFMPDGVKEMLQNGIADTISEILLEVPYVDKDFRDTYYHDFSMRFANIDRDSVRLHFFYTAGCITPENYGGFVTLRDTKIKTIGRSYLHPKVLKNFSEGYYCLSDYKVNIRGVEFAVQAFPWMQQDGNVSRCAHIATWGVIRYFSQKYKYYAEKTLNEMITAHDSKTRKVPSKGMTIDQIAQILANNRFTPEIYFRESFKQPGEFNRLLYTFVESGIPFVAGLLEEQHAVGVIGHGKLSDINTVVANCKGIVDSSDFIEEIILCDDNHLPYSRAYNYENDNHYTYEQIGCIIVPFYQKMYLDVSRLYDFILPKLELTLGLDDKAVTVRRVLLTSSRSFKRFIHEKCKDEIYKEIQLDAQMPYFIWIAEYSSVEQYADGKISHRIIFDATMLNFHDTVYLSIKKEDEVRFKMKIHDESESRTVKVQSKTENMYENNLRRLA